jgi:hypothetical protein
VATKAVMAQTTARNRTRTFMEDLLRANFLLRLFLFPARLFLLKGTAILREPDGMPFF